MIYMFLGSYATNIFNVLLSCSETVWNKCNIPKSWLTTLILSVNNDSNGPSGASYCFCISKNLIVMQLSFHYQSLVRNFLERLQQSYLEWKHFFWPIKKTWLMLILSLAMHLQHSHNHSQEDVHFDTCCGFKLQLLCPILNVLWIILCL